MSRVRDPPTLCGIWKSQLEAGLSLGLSSTTKTLTGWNESSRGQGLQIRRCKKSPSETALFSLKENVVLLAATGERAGGASSFRGGRLGGSKAQAGTEGPSITDKEKFFSP